MFESNTATDGFEEVAGCSCGAKFSTHEAANEHECSLDEQGFFLPDIDEDIRADFAAVGIDLANPELLAQKDREAFAAMLLRRMCEKDLEITNLGATMDLELDMVRRHYARLIDGPTRQRAMYLRHVEIIAELSAKQRGFGKKKSASTPFGSFGIRHASATVELQDAAALLEHLKTNDPSKVKVTAVLPLNEMREYLSETELAKAKMEPKWAEVKATVDPDGALPPGVAKVPEKEAPFAKPEPPTWMLQGADR